MSLRVCLIFAVCLLHLESLYGLKVPKYVHCTTVTGSGPNDEDASIATCSNNYKMTSCSAKQEQYDVMMGGVIDKDDEERCIAYSERVGGPSDFIRAYARCCNLTDTGSSFQSRFSESSGSSSSRSQSCDSNEILIGCTGDTLSNSCSGWSCGFAEWFDGAYAGNLQTAAGDSSKVFNTSNRCTAVNGDTGNGVYAAARCYDTSTMDDKLELECVSVWGSKSNYKSSATCPDSDYFMTSCSAYSPQAMIYSYLINDASEATCEAICEDFGQGADWVAANAICCKLTEEVTELPTTSPSNVPSSSPSNQPSMSPSVQPSMTPSNSPSYTPSDNPSLDSSMAASNDPSQSPSKVPTISPTVSTNAPSDNPSANPSTEPSLNPSFSPSYDPTAEPSKRPTPAPTLHAPIPRKDSTSSPSKSPIDIISTTGGQVTDKSPSEDNKEASAIEAVPWRYIIVGFLFSCCCICSIVCTVKCSQRRKRNKMKGMTKGYQPQHHSVASRSMMKHPVGNQLKEDVVLQIQMGQMKKVNSLSNSPMTDGNTLYSGENNEDIENIEHEGTGTGTGTDETDLTPIGNDTNSGILNVSGNTPGGLLMNDEFIIQDENDMDIITPGSNEALMHGADAMMNIGNDDEVITGSDQTPDGTDDSDEQVIDDEIVTAGMQ